MGDAEGLRLASEEDLAREARGGSVAAFEELARRVQGPLVAFVARRFGSRRDAEDVAQEALIRAYRSIGSYREGRRFRTWLFTIAYRVAVSAGRGERGSEGMTDMGDGQEGALAGMERREREERVWGVARSVLSEEQVTALWLYYVEEMPAGEVARVMGRSWVSVKTMLHRARKKLGPYLVGEVEDGAAVVRAGELR